MAKYEILFRQSVLKKDLSSFPKNAVRKIIETIHSLADDPRPPGAKKLSGREQYRVRQGDYRIVYSIQDQELTIWIVQVGHRRDVYR